jgi:hypothetical protein
MNTTPVLLQYGPPPTPPRTREAVGKVLTVLAAVLGPPAAAVTGFFGLITWSDCFIECSGNPDHLGGGLLIAVAIALLLAAPLLAATLVRRATWVLAAIAVPVLEVLLVTGTLAR